METIDTTKLPRNLEAEQALLGAILANNKAIEKVSEFLKPQHFADSVHAKIFEVVSTLIQRGHIADVITLKNYFEQEGTLNEVGGPNYLIKLADSSSPMTNVEYYGRFIYDKYLRRELINTGTEIVNNAFKETADLSAADQIEEAEQQLYRLSDQGEAQGDFIEFSKALDSSLNYIEKAFQKEGKISGLSTGLEKLDYKTGGLNNSDLIIIAGRPAMGKTALATNIADDTPGVTITSIRTRARRLKRTKGLGLIVIDYIQLITGSNNKKNEGNRVQELSEISRGLKILAKELKVPVIALSQLNRGVEQRDDKRPVMSDLRESGSIEQDADIVMFVYRENYYIHNEEPKMKQNETPDHFQHRMEEWQKLDRETTTLAEVIIGKQRHGPTGTVKLFWNGEYAQFGNLANEENLPEQIG